MLFFTQKTKIWITSKNHWGFLLHQKKPNIKPAHLSHSRQLWAIKPEQYGLISIRNRSGHSRLNRSDYVLLRAPIQISYSSDGKTGQSWDRLRNALPMGTITGFLGLIHVHQNIWMRNRQFWRILSAVGSTIAAQWSPNPFIRNSIKINEGKWHDRDLKDPKHVFSKELRHST